LVSSEPTSQDQIEPEAVTPAAQQAPAEQAPAEQAPAEQEPAEQEPAEQAPGKAGLEPAVDPEPEAPAVDRDGRSTARTGASGRRAELEQEGDVAADFLESLLDIADLDGDLEVNVEGDRAAVAIVDSEDGPAPQRLVGRDGVVLEALQELTRLAVQAETGERSRLMLDVAGHRAGRRAELVTLARAATERVKESGSREALEPMSAFERKVVHDEVLAAGLASESEGAEPQRHVVILPSR
jgi:spoIIIJ-associated protein